MPINSDLSDGSAVNVRKESPITPAEIYREQYAHFRSMNELLYKIPPLFSLAIGGLWYFASSQLHTDKYITIAVFIFAAVLSVCGVHVLGRFGLAFNGYIENLNRLDGEYRVTIKPKKGPSTVKTVQYLLRVSAVVSVIGVIYADIAGKGPSLLRTMREIFIAVACTGMQ